MELKDFDYYLPEELIAQCPTQKRDESRLMVIYRNSGKIEHSIFKDIHLYMNKGDCIVLNDTKVIPARLLGKRKDTGGSIEFVLLKSLGNDKWEVLVKPGKRAKIGKEFIFGDGLLIAHVLDKTQVGGRIVEFEYQGDFRELLNEVGRVPLPPYIKKEINDDKRYQTVYGRVEGSAAAPTAGLHFTQELINKIEKKGVNIAYITLHVGLGTFRPVKSNDIRNHKMHSEYFCLPEKSAEIINSTKKHGNRVIAIGTTTVRTLESVANEEGIVTASEGWTDIFIYPGFKFKIIDGLLTNFHLPKSTLLMLVSAFASRELILNAYEKAIRERYRFFSFGDAMLIL